MNCRKKFHSCWNRPLSHIDLVPWIGENQYRPFAPIILGMDVSHELVDDFERWKSAFLWANESFDLIYVQTKGAIEGWDDEAALQHVHEFIRVPVVTCEEFMMPFSVLGLTQLSEEQGIRAAEMAKRIGFEPGEELRSRMTEYYSQ